MTTNQKVSYFLFGGGAAMMVVGFLGLTVLKGK
jgi:hypothetical protein